MYLDVEKHEAIAAILRFTMVSPASQKYSVKLSYITCISRFRLVLMGQFLLFYKFRRISTHCSCVSGPLPAACSISLVPLVRCNRIIIVEAECLGVSTTELVSKGSWVSYIEVTHLYVCVLIIYFKLNTRYVQDHLPRVLRNEMGPI